MADANPGLAPLHDTPDWPISGAHRGCWHHEPAPEPFDVDHWRCCWCATIRFVPGTPIADATVHGPYLHGTVNVGG